MEEERSEQQRQQLKSELTQTKRHYESFRQHLLKLDVDEVVNADKDHFFFGDWGKGQARRSEKEGNEEEDVGQEIDSSVVAEMKKYKNLLPEDIEVLRQLRLKITNYLLLEQDKRSTTAEGTSSGILGPIRQLKEPLEAESCAAEFEIYSKTIDPRSLTNQMKRNERLIEQCREEFGRHAKALQDMKQWMTQICECSRDARQLAAGGERDVSGSSKSKTRRSEVTNGQEILERLANITNAYNQWSSSQQPIILTDSERQEYAKYFEEKQRKLTLDEISEARQKSIDALKDVQVNLQRLKARQTEGSWVSNQRDSVAEQPSKRHLASDIHETLGSLHSHLASLKERQQRQQEKRLEVDVGKMQEDILTHSVLQIDQRLRARAGGREQNPLPVAELEEQEPVEDAQLDIETALIQPVQENEEQIRAYSELIVRLEEQLLQYQQHQAAEKERERELAEQLETEKKARLLLSQENIEQMVNVAMDEEGAAARTRSQGAQVSRSWFQADADAQVQATTDDKQVQVDLREEARAAQVKMESGILNLEVLDEGGSYVQRAYKSPIGQVDITNMFDEALLESQRKLQGLSPNARTLESTTQIEILGTSTGKAAEQDWHKRLDGKLEERSKLDKLQRELQNVRQANLQLEATKRALDDQANQVRQRATALSTQQAHLNKQKVTLIEKIKQQNVQKQQLAAQELKLEKLQQFLQQREQEQLMVEQALDKEKGQLDEEWQELAKEWNSVEEQKEALKTSQTETKRKEQKMERIRDRLKEQRSRVVQKEKWCIRQETLCRALSGELGRFMRSMDQQNGLMRSLEYAIEQLFSKIQQEGEDGEQWFEEERDAIMVNRYKLEERRKAVHGILRDQRSLHDLNQEQQAEYKCRGRVLSDGGRRRGRSFDSCDSNLSYLHFRYDNSFDAAECRAFNDLKEVVALAGRPGRQAPRRSRQRAFSFVSESGNLPRYSRRSRCSLARSPRASAIRASAVGALRPSQRPSIQIRQSMRASQALVRNSVARRSTIWPHSVKSQVDDVDENMPEEADFQLQASTGKDQQLDLGDSSLLQLDMSVLNPYNMLSPIQDLNEGSEDVDPIRKTDRSDQIMKEISFKTLTRPTHNFYNLNLVNESGSTDSQGGGMDDQYDEEEDEHVDFEYTRTVTEARRSGPRSVTESKPSSEEHRLRPLAQHQGTQASDLPLPKLDLSAYAEYEREVSKSKSSVSVALQTGESIRNSERASAATERQLALEADAKLDPRTSKQSQGQESTLSFANNQSFLLPQQLMLRQAKPSESQRSSRGQAPRQSAESEHDRLNDTQMQVPDPNALLEEEDGASLRRPRDSYKVQNQIFSYDSQGNERLSQEFRLSTEQANEGDDGTVVAAEPGESPSRKSERADVSILNYTMDEFIQSQLADLEKIGISGELFREVWAEYKKQGKSKQQMQSDLIQYQFMIEQKIQRDNRRRMKREKREKEGKHKDKKKDKKDKKEKRKSRRPRPEDAKVPGAEQSMIMEQDAVKAQPVDPQTRARQSSRQFNYDEDYQESSVFIEPFKLQERETIDPDRSLIYHEKRSGEKGMPDELHEQVGTGQHHKSGSSRFSVSFAHGEARSDSAQEVAVEEYADNAEFQQQIQALQVANTDFYGGSLINQVQNNQNLFMIFKERESAKTSSRRSAESRGKPSSGGGSSPDSGAAYEGVQQIEEGSSPGRRVPGMYTRSLKTIVEEANECTENREPSPRESDRRTLATGAREGSWTQRQGDTSQLPVAGRPLQHVSLGKPHHRPLSSKGGVNSSTDMELSSHSNSRRSIKYFEQLKSLNAARKSARPSASSAKSREGPPEADDARASLTAFAATVTHSEHPRGSVRQHAPQEMRRSTINETINQSVNQSDLWENFRVTEREQRQIGRPEAQAFVFGQAPATDSAKKSTRQ